MLYLQWFTMMSNTSGSSLTPGTCPCAWPAERGCKNSWLAGTRRSLAPVVHWPQSPALVTLLALSAQTGMKLQTAFHQLQGLLFKEVGTFFFSYLPLSLSSPPTPIHRNPRRLRLHRCHTSLLVTWLLQISSLTSAFQGWWGGSNPCGPAAGRSRTFHWDDSRYCCWPALAVFTFYRSREVLCI